MKENDMLKHEKQRNTLAELYKPPDHQRIRPLAFSLTYFHLTGQAFYRMQIQRLKKPVLHRLLERGCNSLKDYYALLIDDAADGPAIDG